MGRTLIEIATAWVVISIPAALLIARWLAHAGSVVPAIVPTPRKRAA